MAACKQVLPHMERQGKGAIVNIASVSGIRWLGVPDISYAASRRPPSSSRNGLTRPSGIRQQFS